MPTTAHLGRSAATLAALVAVAVPTLAAQATAAPTPSAKTTLQKQLRRDAADMLRYGSPGVLAGVQLGERNIKVRAGLGNFTTRKPIPLDAKFRIGSMTKPFVATIVLQLVGEGRLTLEDTVERWLPGLVRGKGNDGRKITVRQLLQHTSGLPDYVGGFPWILEQKGFEKHRFDTVTPRQAVRVAMKSKPTFAPGTSWSYSNTGYMLAGMVIEAVTGRDWRDEVRDRIVTPLALKNTTLPGTNPNIPAPHAVGYERFPGPGATPEDPRYGEQIDATRQNVSWGGAAGEIISTVDDGNTFLRALAGGRLLPPAQLAEMQRTVPTNAGFRQNWPRVRYGLGIMRVPTPCGVSWSHGGDIMGFMTRNAVNADGSRSVVVSFNTDSPKRKDGVAAPKRDITLKLINRALCS
ncbi:serine hydrolase domain-containing protein [Patulibacter americanus]|uniref:serine hydrolase domain-containing protein n=1 Tax=Patulibacter americanus TaxID=588672 RepID=UPI0003B72D0C|nr:serine hydrolase domain-containing protein [Patulibacter americanus]